LVRDFISTMKKERSNLKRTVTISSTLVVTAMLLAPFATSGAIFLNPQGKGGEIVPKPSPKTETSRKPTTKAGVVKARLIELFNLCKAGRYSKVSSYLRRGQPDNVCPSVKANTKNGYYFGKFMTQTHPDGEVVAWEVYYRGAADTKGEIWAFQLVNGKYVLVDIDPIRQAPQ